MYKMTARLMIFQLERLCLSQLSMYLSSFHLSAYISDQTHLLAGAAGCSCCAWLHRSRS